MLGLTGLVTRSLPHLLPYLFPLMPVSYLFRLTPQVTKGSDFPSAPKNLPSSENWIEKLLQGPIIISKITLPFVISCFCEGKILQYFDGALLSS